MCLEAYQSRLGSLYKQNSVLVIPYPPVMVSSCWHQPFPNAGKAEAVLEVSAEKRCWRRQPLGSTFGTGGFSLQKLRLCVGGGCFVDPLLPQPHPTQCPLCIGSPRLSLLLAAGKEAASIIHLNVSIKQGYDQDETRNKVF